MSGVFASGRSPCQWGIRHRACRINTHPLYTSRCLSGIAAQSLFLNSLLYYTGQQIATVCLLPCQGCCSPARPGEQGVLRTAQGPPGTSLRLSPDAGSGHGWCRLHWCCCELAAGYAGTRVPQGVSSRGINGMPVLRGAHGSQEVNEPRAGCSVTKSACCWCRCNRIGAGGRTSSRG